jgi:Secretion system C-terminal sorting domain
MIRFYFLVVSALCFALTTQAQTLSAVSSINQTSGFSTNGSLAVYYSFGSPIYPSQPTATSTTGNLGTATGSPAFVHGTLVTALENAPLPEVYLKVFPNPTTRMFTIQLSEQSTLQPRFHVLMNTIDGKCFLDFMTIQTPTEIDLASIPEGVYILTVHDPETKKIIQSFKIVKIN